VSPVQTRPNRPSPAQVTCRSISLRMRKRLRKRSILSRMQVLPTVSLSRTRPSTSAWSRRFPADQPLPLQGEHHHPRRACSKSLRATENVSLCSGRELGSAVIDVPLEPAIFPALPPTIGDFPPPTREQSGQFSGHLPAQSTSASVANARYIPAPVWLFVSKTGMAQRKGRFHIETFWSKVSGWGSCHPLIG